jgi:hypothetical protein
VSDYDDRSSAYLRQEHWPDCIPWTYPKREYGPTPWSAPAHDDSDRDDYPPYHSDAASIARCMGDVCPYCGVPMTYDEDCITIDGETGVVADSWPDEFGGGELADPTYHPDCYRERRGDGSQEITVFVGGGEE